MYECACVQGSGPSKTQQLSKSKPTLAAGQTCKAFLPSFINTQHAHRTQPNNTHTCLTCALICLNFFSLRSLPPSSTLPVILPLLMVARSPGSWGVWVVVVVGGCMTSLQGVCETHARA